MKRVLLRSTAFVRASRRMVKRHPEIAQMLETTLEAMAEDVFQPTLKTHKLKAELAGSFAASAGYDVRIVFKLVQHDGTEAVLLQTIGTHDEVY
jgi:mRNA interferase YafQ